MKTIGFVVIAMAMLIALTGMAVADSGVNQVPETQGITTALTIQAIGTVTETESMVWQLTNVPALARNANGLAGAQVQYVSSYTENTIADQGYTSYAKTLAIDTANKVGNQYNVKADKIVEFIGSDTGRMISEESLLLDGMGQTQAINDVMLCPFAAAVTTRFPAFCNIVEMGSAVDVTIGSLATSADERHVMANADPMVVADYSVKLTGFGDIPAMGSAMAYINAHIQEGRGADETLKAEDLVYSEVSTASGDITIFQKVMNYESGMRRY
jgi:hypothetical protein